MSSREKALDAPLQQMTMVLHGPGVFDSGDAAWLAGLLAPKRILVAGVMARSAALESGIPCAFAMAPPSVVIRSLGEPAYLVNRGKTADSGRIFGEIVASRVGEARLLQVECESREIICWNRQAGPAEHEIAALTGFRIIERQSSQEGPPDGFRVIRGCLPGEPVFVNGTIIGRATASEVCLRKVGAGLVAVSGLEVKEHGLEKLAKAGTPDITRAWCKSGAIRSKAPRAGERRPKRGRVLFVDHCGHRIFDIMSDGEICGIVSVGDDTTAVCGHIGAQMGIPVFGIVDGDCDGIVPPRYAEGSLLAFAEGTTDDELGCEVARIIPGGMVSWDDCVARIVSCLGKRARICRPV